MNADFEELMDNAGSKTMPPGLPAELQCSIGDRLDTSMVYAIFDEAIVEDIIAKKDGTYLRIRGIRSDGTMYKGLNTVWAGTAHLAKKE